MKIFLWNLLLLLPKPIKHFILRLVVQFPDAISTTLRFKVAETQEELEQAFHLLHNAYVHEKLMSPHPSGLRVTKYHALSSTSTLIAIENNVVVGTLSLIRQSSFGLPMESIFNLDGLPVESRLAEVSSLAIKKEYLHQRGRILFPLLKFLYHYSHEYFGITHFVIAVNPKWIDFYEGILMFKPLSKKVVQNYSFVNGAPAVGAVLDLNLAQKIYHQIYSQKKTHRNLSAFFQDLDTLNMEFPLRKRSMISDPILTPTLLDYFFNIKTNCMSTMNDFELTHLRLTYDHSDYLRLIPKPQVLLLKKSRKEKRFDTILYGRLQFGTNMSTRVVIHDIGKHGIGGIVKSEFIKEGTCQLLINIEESNPCQIQGYFTRKSEKGNFGFRITSASHEWDQLIQKFENRLIKIESQEQELKKYKT